MHYGGADGETVNNKLERLNRWAALTIFEAKNCVATDASNLINMEYRLMVQAPPLDFAAAKKFHDCGINIQSAPTHENAPG